MRVQTIQVLTVVLRLLCQTRKVCFYFLCPLIFFSGLSIYPCFILQEMCNSSCKCCACHNTSAAVDARQSAVENLLNKKPDCFKPKVCSETLQICIFFINIFFLVDTDVSRSVKLQPISMYEEILPVLRCEQTMYRCVSML